MSKQLNRIARGNIEIATSPQFALVSGLITTLQHKIVEGCGTAYTNGLHVGWDPKFVDSLTQKELNFVIVHEAAHVMFMHISMWKHLWNKNPKKANAAADYVVNAFIKEADPNEAICKMPTDKTTGKVIGLYDPQWIGKSTLEVWTGLGDGDGTGNGDGYGKGFDVHDWDELTEEQKKEVEVAINVGKKRAAIQGRKVDIAEVEEVNWEDMLSQWVQRVRGSGNKTSWDRPNRRHIGRGIYFPQRCSSAVKECVVAIDVSGSVYEELRNRFVYHCKAMCEAVNITKRHFIYWDCGVDSHEIHDIVTGEKLIEETRPGGGGGTVFEPVLDYIEEQGIDPMFMIGMTDGWISEWGDEPHFPSIWLINTDVVAPYGETLKIKDAV